MLSPLRARAPAAVERGALTACVGLLSLAAWLSLVRWPDSPLLHFHHLSGLPGAPLFLLFVASWTVMTVAMMLPTGLPVLATLHCLAGPRPDRMLLVALAAAGYLLIWTFFGALVFTVYLVWARLLKLVPWLAGHAPAAGPLLLCLAGAFQFSSLKYKCLEKCRSPFGFVIEHWQGSRERWQAFRLGLDHGLYCVGCCWALMLLMLAVGAGSVAWMLVLALVMALEKNLPGGRRLSAPVGVILLMSGVALLWLR